MDGGSLAKSKATWEDALQSAILNFRTLISSSSSKAWKPVPSPHASNNGVSGSSSNAPPGIGLGVAGGVGVGAGAAAGAGAGAGVGPSRSSTAGGQIKNTVSAASASASDPKGKGKGRESVPGSLPGSQSPVSGGGADGGAGSGTGGRTGSGTGTGSSTGTEMKPFVLCTIDPASIVVHRKAAKGPDVYRATADVNYEGTPDLEGFKAVLQTPDARSVWDRMVEEAELMELLDPQTRICKTDYRLGWPASPRDAITISRTLYDGGTLVDVSTSLPRSPDAPAYLRPAPPYVRSHVNLFAWCIQVPSSDQNSPRLSGRSARQTLKLTAFWSWDLKGAWLGMPAGGLSQQLPILMTGLVDYVRDGSNKLPTLSYYGSGVEVLNKTFDPTRDTLATEYSIVMEDEAVREAEDRAEKDLDALNALRERRRLEGCIEFSLPAAQGWDVRVFVKAQTGTGGAAEWKASAERSEKSSHVTLRLSHAKLETLEEFVKVEAKIQRVAASTGLRLNGAPYAITETEPRTPAALSKRMLEDTSSISGVSVATNSTDGSSSVPLRSATASPNPASNAAAIAALIRRNYIYFTSLLQEPEAKWKRVSDSRGVTVTQLDSIDPTLVVFRAEATFVGVGVWDLFSTINSPGARAHWDKGMEDARLLGDINDLSSLWHHKTKAAWPVSARDSVTVQTSYKSPASVHIFSFSTDDRNYFPQVPTPEAGTIRTQVDLLGWSVESLSPTTVHITLLEQSDPKGWTSKTAIPAQMVSAVAGVGDYAIRFGGPPVATRLLGAKAKVAKYDHEKATFRLEYDAVESTNLDSESPHIECELRCDLETWAANLDLVVDPPPISVSCLRRHKLSQGGGGLWLTIEHAAASLEEDSARITVRKGQGLKEKGLVLVNGARMKVDIDELREDEVQQLTKRKRTKPKRVPLDLSSPAGQAVRELDSSASSIADSSRPGTPVISDSHHVGSGPPAPSGSTASENEVFSDERPRQPMTCALDVLFLLRRIYAERSPDPAGSPAGWSLVSERNGLYVRRKVMQSISSTVAVQRGDKVVQGLSAEDLINAVSSLSCRKQWDDKVDSTTLLESFGNSATTSFVTTKSSFPFRGRGFHLASLTARAATPSSSSSLSSGSSSLTSPSVYFHAAASFPERSSTFPASRLNPTGLPMGKILIDGWILETLDPYNSNNFPIPSTRCTHVVAIDYAGSLPIAVNNMWNATLPRSILLVEDFIKSRGALPSVRSPPPCMQVLGDGRDEDQGLVWVLEDEGRRSTMLSSKFSPGDRNFDMLALIDPESTLRTRPHAISNASTTKASARSAITATPTDESSKSIEPPADLPRAESNSSIITPTPSTIRKRPSAIRSDSRKVRNMVLADVEVELKHFSKGYEIAVGSVFRPDANSDDGPPAPHALSLDEPVEGQADLPITTAVYDLPPSALLAATLDPSARPRRHLVRLCLPTAKFLEVVEDPLTEKKVPEVPEWYAKMQQQGALIRLIIRPLGNSEETPAGNVVVEDYVPVLCAGKKLEIVHVNQTSAMLQREHATVENYARLKRAPPPPRLKAEVGDNPSPQSLDDRLPPLLQYPIAAALDLKRELTPEKPAGAAETAAKSPAEKNGKDHTATANKHADPSTPVTAASKSDKNADKPASEATTTPIMSILGAYPLSRLSSSNPVVSTLTASGLSAKGGRAEQTSGEKAGNGSAVGSSGPSEGDANTSTSVVPMQGYRLSTLILTAIIAFLVGSLIRALLSPADFVLLPRDGFATTVNTGGDPVAARTTPALLDQAAGEVERYLQLARGIPHAGLTSDQVSWREIRRLVEIKRLLAGWDLVLAVVRRN